MEKEQAPDGGYGWVIVFAFAGNCIIVVPIMQGFGLLFRHVFQELQMPVTDISSIINVNSAFGLLLGLFNGPLLKKFKFRKVAIAGGVLMSVGLALTSSATSFSEFIIYYGIINSVGFTVTMASYNLALNTYFDKRRNLAVGLCTAITGLGPVIMPIVISFLIDVYGVRGTTLILAGLTLNTLAGALLLHPVSWHYRKGSEEISIEKELELLNAPLEDSKVIISEPQNEDESEEDFDIDAMHGLEKVMIPKKTMENGESLFASKLSLYEKAPVATWWRNSKNSTGQQYASQYSIRRQEKKQSKKKSQKWTTKIVKLFDLDLLQDPGYRIIWFGMSLAFTGEINFSLMTPLILGDKGWDVQETATLMSLLAFSDIIMRFISPFIGDVAKLPAKQMYMISLIFLVISRSTLAFVNGWTQTLISCVVIGIAKGFRTVYMGLVIPSYVPLEKLASATGLQTVLNGLFLFVVGPILGYIRDKSGSYTLCIFIINSLSLITITLWTVDMILTRQVTNAPDNQKKPVES